MKPTITVIQAQDDRFLLFDTPTRKWVRSPAYNYNFNKETGVFARWGKTFEDDPKFAPAGPEILDIEISVDGCPNGCPFCYKGNTPKPATNMTLAEFKSIINKFPKTLTQVAFGITGIQTNPDFIPMMQYCREIGIIPNFTLSGIDLTDEIAEQCAGLVGALAVSAYQTDKNVCYSTVKKFTDLGINQTNIHLMVAQETLPFVYEVMNDRMTDPRLQGINAIVFLGVKPKGRAVDGWNTLRTSQYQELIQFCFDHNLAIGFDSCSAPKFEEAIKQMDLPDPLKKRMIECSEGCESSAFSGYINVHVEYWHCSFSENEVHQQCVDVASAENFLRDIWYSPAVEEFRTKLLNSEIDGCRRCTVFPQINPEFTGVSHSLEVLKNEGRVRKQQFEQQLCSSPQGRRLQHFGVWMATG